LILVIFRSDEQRHHVSASAQFSIWGVVSVLLPVCHALYRFVKPGLRTELIQCAANDGCLLVPVD